MCLVVYCNGCSTTKGNLTILVRVLKGKYDDHLKWPLNCTAEIEISNLKGADSIRHFYAIKAQNRVYDNYPNLQYIVDHTKTLSLSFLGLYPYQGSLKIDVNCVTRRSRQ